MPHRRKRNRSSSISSRPARPKRPQKRERIRSTRIATQAIRGALSELSPQSRARARASGLVTSRAVVSTNTDAIAQATRPAITFAAAPSGALITKDVKGTSRHEVAHFSLPSTGIVDLRSRAPLGHTARDTGRQHFALRVAGAGPQGLPSSRAVLRRSESAIRMDTNRQLVTALKKTRRVR